MTIVLGVTLTHLQYFVNFRNCFLIEFTTLSEAKVTVVGLNATTRFEGLDVNCGVEGFPKFPDPLTPYRDP